MSETASSPTDIWASHDGLTNSQLHEEYLHRLTEGRDLRVYITANAETGVGKTTLAFALALLWDQHGWTADKATLDPREYSKLYDEMPPGSVLVLDEAEQAVDRRDAMRNDVQDVGHAFATKRYRQIFGILTLPSKDWMDDRIGEQMADYWIQAQETDKGAPKGEANVYRLKSNEHYETTYQKKVEVISWPILDWHPEFRALEQKKISRMEGQVESKYVPREEVEDLKQNYWDKATKKTRYHLVNAMVEHGVPQKTVSDILKDAEEVEGLGPSMVSRIVNSDSFEEVYS